MGFLWWLRNQTEVALMDFNEAIDYVLAELHSSLREHTSAGAPSIIIDDLRQAIIYIEKACKILDEGGDY
jgi:biotin-(acetyl-CoA carboxylase) ligase